MNNKILIISSVARQFYLFEHNNISVLEKLGFEIHGAANFNDKNERLKDCKIIQHHILIKRNPFNPINIIALFQLIQIIYKNNISAVHCHSPIGGVLGRLAAKLTGVKHIIYTAHGFHFYKGAPLINWLLYYPIEYVMSFITDYLIVINDEDYNIARKFKVGSLILINGIGINVEKYNHLSALNRVEYRNKFGINENGIIIISIGELSSRKNYKLALDIFSDQCNSNSNILYVICGTGKLEKELKDYAKKLKIENKVLFLGFRNDIANLCNSADIFMNTTKQEGLPVSVLEAMATGLPVLCTDVRGNNDLILNYHNGLLFTNKDDGSINLNLLINNKSLRDKMRDYNLNIIGKYSNENIMEVMNKIYSKIKHE